MVIVDVMSQRYTDTNLVSTNIKIFARGLNQSKLHSRYNNDVRGKYDTKATRNQNHDAPLASTRSTRLPRDNVEHFSWT